jgi:hypothetical protein
MDEESIWKPIPEFSLYEINQFGEVRNKETFRTKKPHHNKDGTKIISLYSDQPGVKTSNRGVAKMVMELFGEPCPSDRIPLVEVIDGNRDNTHISNLRWTVPSPQMAETVRQYNRPRKSKRGARPKLNPREVLPLYDTGASLKELAEKFGVTKESVGLLVRHYRKAY